MSRCKNVLVTGAKGQLALSIKYLFNNAEPINWIFKSSRELNIANRNEVRAFFNNNEIDYCVNCAAYTNVEEAEEQLDKAQSVNYEGVKNIVDFIANKSTVLIHISTDYVFDGNKLEPYKEEDKTNPINSYGASKLAGENYIIKNTNNYYIIRTSWLYSNYGKNFYKTVKQKISKNMPMQVVSTQIGAPTSALDLSRAIFHMIQKDTFNFGVYHFSNGGSTNWYIFAKKIEELLSGNKSIYISEVETFKTKAKRPKNSKLNSEKFEGIFDYQIPSWEEALLEIIKTSPE